MIGEFDRSAPLPEAMQGRWVDLDDPAGDLHIDGGEVRYRGRAVEYDFKIIGEDDGALTVDLKVNDPARDDDFQRENLTGLVVDPEGNFHGFNTRFASEFARAE